LVVGFVTSFFFFLKNFRFFLNGGDCDDLNGLTFFLSFLPFHFFTLNFFFGLGGLVSQPNLLG